MSPSILRVSRRVPVGASRIPLRDVQGLRRGDILHAPRTGEFFDVSAVLRRSVRVERRVQTAPPTELWAGDYLLQMWSAKP